MKDWIYPNQNRQTPATTPFPYQMPGVTPSVPGYFYPAEGTGLLLPIPPFPMYPNWEEYERDKKYLTSLYPEFLIPVLNVLLRRLDREHSETGFLYDRYPDRELLLRMVYEIYDQLAEEGDAGLTMPAPSEPGSDDQLAPPITVTFTKNPRNPWLLGLIQVLLSNEILARRRNRSGSRYY